MSSTEYSDELIIKARQRMEEAEVQRHSDDVVQEEIKQSIHDGVVNIFGIPVVFTDRKVVSEKAILCMPEDFIARTDAEISSVYFLGSKPQEVYSNGYLGFMVALNWTENTVADAYIHDFSQFAKTAIERIGPKSRILSVDKLSRPNSNLAIVQFLAQTFDSVNLNVMFFASIDDRLLIGSITFNQKDAARLRPLAVEIAKSFQPIIQEEGENQ